MTVYNAPDPADRSYFFGAPPDPYTWATRLCDDAGMVSHEVAFNATMGPKLTLTYLDVLNNLRMHTKSGSKYVPITEPFHCTGSAHLAGEHIRCTSPAHKGLAMWSEEPGVYVEPGGTVIRSTGTAHAHNAGQPSEDLAAAIAFGGGRSENIQVPARRAVTHDVKCWPVYFERVLDGSKTFEIRLNDRDYQEGDGIVLNEWDPDTEHYTHRRLSAVVGYVLRDHCAAIPDFAGHVIFSLHRVVVEA